MNDLKRRPEDAAKDLGVPIATIEDILNDKIPLAFDLVLKACEVWPVNERDFFGIRDDCPNGVLVMDSKRSLESSRVMARAGRPYYEYRDTVMTRVTSFRPEWIRELCVVADSDPHNELVQWNKGHFMHQFTYFYGPVNFYYLDDQGEKKVAEMSTGDSMYISPYTPHTFTTRENEADEKGLILALTFGDKVVGDSLYELGALAENLGVQFFLNVESQKHAHASLLTYYRNNLSIGAAELSRQSGITEKTLAAYESGEILPDLETVRKVAAALGVNLRDLLPADSKVDRVVIGKRDDSQRTWNFPEKEECYRFSELAHTRSLPHVKPFFIEVLGGGAELSVGLHQYIYNIGESALELSWKLGDSSQTHAMNPGDSCYIKPFVEHSFRGAGSLLVLRIGGKLAGEPMRELSAIGRKFARRVMSDSDLWFSQGSGKP